MRRRRSGSRKFWTVVKGDTISGGGGKFKENAPRTESRSKEKGWKREVLVRGRGYDKSFVGVVVVVVQG